MPTPAAHSLAGVAVYLGATSRRQDDLALLGATVVAACLPDVDFGLSFLTGENYHHYFTHSLGFTTLFFLAAWVTARLAGRERALRDAALVGAAYLSHIGLDMLSKDTAAPYGVELFWPFADTFVISPVLVFDDIWRGTLAKLFGLHNWLAVAREVAVVGAFVLAAFLWREKRHPKSRRAYSE